MNPCTQQLLGMLVVMGTHSGVQQGIVKEMERYVRGRGIFSPSVLPPQSAENSVMVEQ